MPKKSEELLKDILKRNNICFNSFECMPDNAGRMKEVFCVDSTEERYGVFIYNRDEAGERGRSIEERIRTEAYIFDSIREKTELRSPRVIDFGKNYLVCTWLEGNPIGNLEEIDWFKTARAMGSALSEIHEIKFEAFGEVSQKGLNPKFNSWRAFIQEMIEGLREHSEKKIADEALTFLEQNISLMEYSPEPVLIHGDFHEGNILDGSPLGIIDCEAGFSGAREYEIDRCIFHCFDWSEKRAVTEEFLDGYGHEKIDDDWEERQNYYRVLHAVNGMIDGRKLGSNYLIEINEKELRKKLESGL